MSDVLFAMWLRMFADGTDPAVRRQVCRAMLLAGTGGPFFDLEGPFRVGHRRWEIG